MLASTGDTHRTAATQRRGNLHPVSVSIISPSKWSVTEQNARRQKATFPFLGPWGVSWPTTLKHFDPALSKPFTQVLSASTMCNLFLRKRFSVPMGGPRKLKASDNSGVWQTFWLDVQTQLYACSELDNVLVNVPNSCLKLLAHGNEIVLVFFLSTTLQKANLCFATYNTFSSLARLISDGACLPPSSSWALWPSLPVSDFSGNVPLLSAAIDQSQQPPAARASV